MSVNSKCLACSAGLIAAASFAVCAFFVAVAPAATTAAFSYVMHIDLSSLNRHISWSSFLVGMVIFASVVALHAGLVGWLYNAFSRKDAAPSV